MHYIDLALLSANLKNKALSLGYAVVATPQKLLVQNQADLRKASGKQEIFVSSSSGDLLKKIASRPASAPLLIDAFSVPSFFKDDGLIRTIAKESGAKPIAFAIPYAYILRSSFVYRARLVAQYKLFLAKCIKRNAPFVIVSGAENEFELKSPREAIALAELLGLSFEQAQKALGSSAEKLLAQQMEK